MSILTLAEGVEWAHVLSLLSLAVGLGALAVTILKHLDGRAERERTLKETEREKRADERHEVICDKLDATNTRVSCVKETIEEFRGEAASEFRELHEADARLALDLERRVAPIEGKLGIGRVADKAVRG